MNRRTLVLGTVLLAGAAFIGGAVVYKNAHAPAAPEAVESGTASLVRPHSAIIGPISAPVTIVEFLDPACEACRAFHPIVKQLMARYPQDVRLVVRYAPFHTGADEAVKWIEAARKQNKFEEVLNAVFLYQSQWATHSGPDLRRLEDVVKSTGLDIEQARKDAASFEVAEVLRRDMADVTANKVNATPTFYVNGKPLPSFGPQPLADMIAEAVQASRAATPAP